MSLDNVVEMVPLQQRFEDCHGLLHQWRTVGPIGIDDELPEGMRAPFGSRYGMVGIHSFCVCCGSERIKWLFRSGEILNRYKHTDGYLQNAKTGPVYTRAEFRQIIAERMFRQFGIEEPKPKRRGRKT